MTRPIFIIFFLPEKSDTVDVVWVGVGLKKVWRRLEYTLPAC
jgi:hypothetical protein